MISPAVLAAVGRLYGLLALGWALRRLGAGSSLAGRIPDVLTQVVTGLTMPALILATLLSRRLDPSMAGAVVAALGGLAASLAAAWAVGRRVAPDRRVRGAFLVTATFCNTGFLGIPLAAALWGEGSAGLSTAVMVDAFTTTLLLNTVGVAIAMFHGGGEGDRPAFDRAVVLRLLRSPMFLAVPVGLGLQLGGVSLGRGLDVLQLVGAPTGPLVFLATGMRLRFGALRDGVRPLGALLVIRFLVSPAVALGMARLVGLHGETGLQAVLEVAMPTALIAPVIAARYGCDPKLGPIAVAVSTALAPLALLAWLGLAGGVLG